MEQEQDIISLKKVPSVPFEDLPAPLKKPPPKMTKHTNQDFEERVYDEGEVTISERYEAEKIRKTDTISNIPDGAKVKTPKENEPKDSTEDKWSRKTIPRDEKEEDKITLKQTPKGVKEEAPTDPSLARKKLSRLPSDEKEQETVKLKLFQKYSKAATVEPEKDKDKESVVFKRGERQPRDEDIKEPVDCKKADRVPSAKEEPQAVK